MLKHIWNFKKWSTHHEIKQHTQEAYEEAKDFVNSFYGPLHSGPQLVILDSGCGVGLSSFNLGKQFPDTPVIGIDRSENRLTRRLKLDDGRLVKGGELRLTLSTRQIGAFYEILYCIIILLFFIQMT